LAALSRITVIPLAVSIFVGEPTAVVLELTTSFWASTRAIAPVPRFEIRTLFFSPESGCEELELELPQPASRTASPAVQRIRRYLVRDIIDKTLVFVWVKSAIIAERGNRRDRRRPRDRARSERSKALTLYGTLDRLYLAA
jgi:hypothetical protein